MNDWQNQMVILHNYHTCLSNHTPSTNQHSHIYYIIPKETIPCPICNGPLRVRDVKPRKAKEANGEINIYYLRRLKCYNCGSMHLELPDLLIPHKHYTRSAIEGTLAGTISSCIAENSTIYRWNLEQKQKHTASHNPASIVTNSAAE